MSTATIDSTEHDVAAEAHAPQGEGATACPHCRKTFDAVVDWSQPPRLQGAKCPNCRLFVPARHIHHDAD